jgi:HAD superfamily hydrolase (TIGR01549 family)
LSEQSNASTACCILFDLDGTLYDSSQYSKRLEEEIVRFLAENLLVDAESAKRLLNLRRRELLTLTRALESLGIDRTTFFESMAARIDPADYISEDATLQTVIAELKGLGYRVGLVSNSGRPLVEKILKALRLDSSLFDAIVTSSDVQPKPSHEPFLCALRLMSCTAGSAIYVGDRDEAELHPAKEIGIRTILLDRSGCTAAHWADVVVRDMSEIPQAARRMFPS